MPPSLLLTRLVSPGLRHPRRLLSLLRLLLGLLGLLLSGLGLLRLLLGLLLLVCARLGLKRLLRRLIFRWNVAAISSVQYAQ